MLMWKIVERPEVSVIYIYIYIYIERERERERERDYIQHCFYNYYKLASQKKKLL